MDDIMLVVDDVEMNREILKVLFHTHYEIMEAETGEEALEILERCEGSIDIVLLDLVMPGMSGFELMEQRLKLPYFQNVPVVVITGSDHMEDQVRAFEMGANDFIVKPFSPEIVVSRVNNVMASNRRMLSIELEAQKLKIKSELDEMTGLYNKATTEAVMDATLQGGRDRLHVMLIIDVDNFKTVNDMLGHQEGDRAIKVIARLIASEFRKTDIAGRIGGDEFCVMMVDVPSMEVVYAKINELLQIMRFKPGINIPEYVTLSIGVATNRKKSMTYAKLFKKADEALYQAKKGGKAQYREYGVEPITMEEDSRPAVMLLSSERTVCSVLHALIPSKIRIIEITDAEDIEYLDAKDKEKVKFMYVDISDEKQNTEDMWKQLEAIDWIRMDNVFAICQEGKVPQYKNALQHGAADIIMTPIDNDSFKRRLKRQMEKLHMKE